MDNGNSGESSSRLLVEQILNNSRFRRSLEDIVSSFDTQGGSPNVSNLSNTQTCETPQTPLQEIRRLFPSVRRNNNNNGNRRRSNNFRHLTRKTFKKDIIKVNNIQYATLKGAAKALAFERGNAYSSVIFEEGWSSDQVTEKIKNLFSIDEFDFLVPIGGRLTKPNLENGQQLNGEMLKTVYNQKPVYVSLSTVNCNPSEDSEDPPDDMLIAGFSGASQSEVLDDLDGSLDEAVAASFRNTSENLLPHFENQTLEDVLFNLRMNINNDKTTIFNIQRQEIFMCVIRTLKRKSFDPWARIDVVFCDSDGTSEGAIDGGGPTREFFRLALSYLKNSQCFIGTEKKFISLHMEALDKKYYYYCGQLISLSLVHGGPGPGFFSTNFYNMIVGKECEPSIDYIEDDLKAKILKLFELDDINAVNDYLSSEQIFSIAGVYSINNVEDKQKVIDSVLLFYNIHRVKPALDQFVEGLKTCNVYNIMMDYPSIFESLMCQIVNATSSFFSTFKVCHMSEEGSNKRNREYMSLTYWRDYVLDCESNDSDVTLQQLLVFITGAEYVPALGFTKTPEIMFLSDCDAYPKANTCALHIQLPICYDNYEEFKLHVDFAINNCEGFGFA